MSNKDETIFNTLVLYEKVLKNRVKNLKGANIDVVPMDEKKKLDYYSKMYSNDGFRVEYQLPELKKFGRIKQVPYTGLGTFCKEVRGYLAKDVYIDVDMVNCHPVILNWLFVKSGINNSIIEESVLDRNVFLKKHNMTKEAYLSMINTEICQSDDPIIRTLHNQIYTDLLSKMRVQFPEIDKYVRSSRATNKKGKIIANVLQEHEFQILTSMFKFCEKSGVLVDVLMHDGFFIRITDVITEDVIKEKYIDSFEKHVMESFGIPMKFKVKPHDTSIVIKEEPENNEYELMKQEFEKQHCKIINKSFFVKEDDTNLTIFSKQKLETSYSHLNFPKKDGISKFISTWLDDSNMRLYNDIGCYPDNTKCPIDNFNTWRKFSMELITEYTPNEEALQLFLNHIRILCNNDDEIYNYFIKWTGQMIKFPEVKSICPVLISKEGAGKGTFIELMRKMLGSSKVLETTDPSRDVWAHLTLV
ncbi:MAG: hypothetical protein H7339_11285 [Arcicella sp.]|nr:hypothetical protein [Arcicella sp.]